jgi:hypothetical protein
MPFSLNSLVLFGFYCLLIGYLIVKSTFILWLLAAGVNVQRWKEQASTCNV